MGMQGISLGRGGGEGVIWHWFTLCGVCVSRLGMLLV